MDQLVWLYDELVLRWQQLLHDVCKNKERYLIEVIMRWLLVLLLLFGPSVAPSQTPAPVSPAAAQGTLQLSPQAAYDEASRPLEIVRKSVGNWSEVEQAALAVGSAKASAACSARSPFEFTGEDLLAYARLCAFAQSWQPAQQAAMGYLIAQSAATPAEKLTGFPNLSMAFDYEVQASLHLDNEINAFGTAQTMLRTVPYDDLASDAVNSVVRYIQLIHTDQAIVILQQRQPLLLALLKSRASGTSISAAKPSTRTPLTIHDLYADAIALPAMQQFVKKTDAAAASFAELEAAVPASLLPDDAILTAASRRQYLLLGSPLPAIQASALLLDPASRMPPDLTRKSAGASALLLFPDWCAQCVAMNPLFRSAAARLKQEGVRFYALLAQADPQSSASKELPKPPAKTAHTSNSVKSKISATKTADTLHAEIPVESKPKAADLLAGTSTLIVPNETLNTFDATDFPMLIVTDPNGIVRYIQTAPQNVLVEGGLIYQVSQRVLEQWPIRIPNR